MKYSVASEIVPELEKACSDWAEVRAKGDVADPDLIHDT